MHHLSVKLAGGSEQCQLLVLQVDLKVLLHLNLCFVKKNPGFGLSVGFRVSVGFGFGYGFSPESEFGLGSGFGFGCQTLHPNRTRPIAILKHIEH